MHDPNKYITISLNHEKFKKVIFEVQDKENAARKIQDTLGK